MKLCLLKYGGTLPTQAFQEMSETSNMVKTTIVDCKYGIRSPK
jgi:hypothetical protein